MSIHPLMSSVLPILHSIKGDGEKLKKVLHFLETEILPGVVQEDEVITIPEEFEKQVSYIADSISFGNVCYLNRDTLEVEDFPKDIDVEEWEDSTGEQLEIRNGEWKNVIYFEPLESSEAFNIMERFAAQLDNVKLNNHLMSILGRKKPFAQFNHYIHNSDHREEWFAFKKKAYERIVREMIYDELNKEE